MLYAVLSVFRTLTGTSDTTLPGEIDDVTSLLPIDVGVKSEVQHPYLQRLETEMQYNQLEANWKGLKESQCGLLPLIIHHLGALVPMIAFMVHLQDFPVCNWALPFPFWESVFENR